ncbi:MAG: Ig-like domain-containing protein [Candidatus Kapabacteria bacterium]|nr:Ig-like domain-containing protein [Candidatus Kapabacteria bacterium]
MRAIIYGVCCVAWSCANPAPPKGGQLDKTPPKIIATYPPQRALNVLPLFIMLEFNKFIQQRSQVQQNIFLTPPLKVEYSWSGKAVYLNLKEKLDSHTTVIVTLGTQYSDWDGNKPEAAYTLTFSTGSVLDSGVIRATVETDKTEGLTAFLYQLPPNPDTLNPYTTKPKYKTQLGSNKTLEFPALAAGKYRLFVVRDEFRNDVIDRGIDAVGIATDDIDISGDTVAETRIRMEYLDDIVPPKLMDVRVHSARHFVLRMSEHIHPSSLRPEYVLVHDSIRVIDSVALPRVAAMHLDPNDPSLVWCYMEKSLQDSIYRAVKSWCIQVTRMQDSAGNYMESDAGRLCWSLTDGIRARKETQIQGTANAQFVRAHILPEASQALYTAPLLSDSVRGVVQKPRITLLFSEALSPTVTTAVYRSVAWEDEQGHTIAYRAGLVQANALLLEVQTPLAPSVWHTLTIRTGYLSSWSDLPLRDSLVVLRFQTDDARDYSSISGVLVDSSATKNMQGKRAYILVLEAINSSGKDISADTIQLGTSTENRSLSPYVQQRFELRRDTEGVWEIRNVPSGLYRLSVIVDNNGNGKYDKGSVFPFVPAERMYVFPKNILVRPRWMVNDILLVVH